MHRGPAHWVDSEHPPRSLICGGFWSQEIPDLCPDPWGEVEVQVCFACQGCLVDQVETDSQCQESDSWQTSWKAEAFEEQDEGMDQTEGFQKAGEHLIWVLASSEQKDLRPGGSLHHFQFSWSRLHNFHLNYCPVAHLSNLLPRSYQNLQIQKYVVD